jgi:hypothetical protein
MLSPYLPSRLVLVSLICKVSVPSGHELLSIAEISAMWSLSRRTIRRILDNEPGILALGHPGNEHRQRYQRLRVPESVLRRIYDRMRSQ